MNKYLISLLLAFLLVGCYSYRPMQYDAMPSVSSSLDDDGFSCYHEGKKYSTGSVVKINGVTKECSLSFWRDESKKQKVQNTTTWGNDHSQPDTQDYIDYTRSDTQGYLIDDDVITYDQTSYGGKIGEIKEQNTGQFCYFNGQRYSHGSELTVKNKDKICRNGSWEGNDGWGF